MRKEDKDMQEEMLMNISKQLDTLIDMLTKEEKREPTNKVGRPNKGHIVKKFRNTHPDFSKVQCQRITGLSIKTISKYWNIEEGKQQEKEWKQCGKKKKQG